MTEPSRSRNCGDAWLGVHLFFEGDVYSEIGDRVVLEVAAPFVEGLGTTHPGTPWFFLRYSEGGSHIRLRVRASWERLDAEVRPAIEQAAARAAPLVRHLAFVPYEPEIERYGGPHGLVAAERLFHHSSETTLALLRGVDADPSARFGKALLAMLIQLHVFCARRELAAALAEAYGTGYLRAQVPEADRQEQWIAAFHAGLDRQANHLANSVEGVWEALAVGARLTPDLDCYRDRMTEIATVLHKLCEEDCLLLDGKPTDGWPDIQHRIVPSYLHMMNNRLGVSIRDECYLSVLISRFLGAQAQETPEAIPLQDTV